MAKIDFPKIIPLIFSIILYASSFSFPVIFNIKLQNIITDINYTEIATNLTFSNIVINNTIVVIVLVIGGFFMGIPTIINLTWNGYFIGVLVRTIHSPNIGFDKIIFLTLPHAIFEIPAIITAGAAGFKIPCEVIRYLLGRKEQVLTKQDIKECLTLAALSIILVVIAAWVEASVTLRIARRC